MIGVVLAAGLGTRLRPVTNGRSKATVPVVGRPLIARVMDTLRAAEVRDFVIVVGPQGREVEAALRQRPEARDHMRFVLQRERLGMAHALGCASDLLREEFVLSACDSLTVPEDVAALVATHRRTGADVTLAVMEVEPEAVSRSAAVEIDGAWVRRIVEKPTAGEAPSTTISLSLYVCSPAVLGLLPKVRPSQRGEHEMADLFQLLIDRGGRVAHHAIDHRLHVSSPEDLLALNLSFLSRDPSRLEGRPETLGAGSRLVPPVVIGEGVRVGAECQIGPMVYLEGQCWIEDEVELRDAVVLRGATLERRSRVKGKLVWA
jgi:NDP-sugar pyrophosphorylase family protein